MTPEGEEALRSMLDLARTLRVSTGPALVRGLELVLTLEGLARGPSEPPSGTRSRKAINQANYRLRHKTNGNANGNTGHALPATLSDTVTDHVTDHVTDLRGKEGADLESPSTSETAGSSEEEPGEMCERDRGRVTGNVAGSLPDNFVRLDRPFWVERYKVAVSRVTGSPYVFPEKAFGALRSVVETHCVGEARKDIPAWVERVVGEFARAVKGKAQFYSSFGPDGLLKWHNEPRAAAAAVAPARPYVAPKPDDGPYRPREDRGPRKVDAAALAAAEDCLAKLGVGGIGNGGGE